MPDADRLTNLATIRDALAVKRKIANMQMARALDLESKGAASQAEYELALDNLQNKIIALAEAENALLDAQKGTE